MGGINPNRGPRATTTASQASAEHFFDGLSDYFRAQADLERAVILEGADDDLVYPALKKYEQRIAGAAQQLSIAKDVSEKLGTLESEGGWANAMSAEMDPHFERVVKAGRALAASSLTNNDYEKTLSEGLQKSLWHDNSNANIRRSNYEAFEAIISLLQTYLAHVKTSNGD